MLLDLVLLAHCPRLPRDGGRVLLLLLYLELRHLGAEVARQQVHRVVSLPPLQLLLGRLGLGLGFGL